MCQKKSLTNKATSPILSQPRRLPCSQANPPQRIEHSTTQNEAPGRRFSWGASHSGSCPSGAQLLASFRMCQMNEFCLCAVSWCPWSRLGLRFGKGGGCDAPSDSTTSHTTDGSNWKLCSTGFHFEKGKPCPQGLNVLKSKDLGISHYPYLLLHLHLRSFSSELFNPRCDVERTIIISRERRTFKINKRTPRRARNEQVRKCCWHMKPTVL